MSLPGDFTTHAPSGDGSDGLDPPVTSLFLGFRSLALESHVEIISVLSLPSRGGGRLKGSTGLRSLEGSRYASLWDVGKARADCGAGEGDSFRWPCLNGGPVHPNLKLSLRKQLSLALCLGKLGSGPPQSCYNVLHSREVPGPWRWRPSPWCVLCDPRINLMSFHGNELPSQGGTQ